MRGACSHVKTRGNKEDKMKDTVTTQGNERQGQWAKGCLCMATVMLLTTAVSAAKDVNVYLLADPIYTSRSGASALSMHAPHDRLAPPVAASDLAYQGRTVSGPRVSAAGSGGAVGLGVHNEFSTWSDLTAMFRPSRWRHPLQVGGSLSWLNFRAWSQEPARTGTVLLGEAIVIGTAYLIYDSNRSSSRHNGSASGSGTGHQTGGTLAATAGSGGAGGSGGSGGSGSSGGSGDGGGAGGGEGSENGQQGLVGGLLDTVGGIVGGLL